ncbi:D-alanine--D-alanine ligase [Clostridium tagluense]|uniref:D-alanine--D-alanine ligase family protein n=1 Tax=Clostridium tagluense TaxID=360422 RepID=UPI001CF3B3C9|nr:D-alanine--D-alanine ligase [Clostridium tagluense]MCB2313015.1 D-alanine--D-alanine ligase [Clostridium tagluense]MCB2317747.1 D-alanine--D-alanine ligase [Clostridium tagluense]MCB2322565.1 D-alanine--D-alanine ligase [Clostridium tagluense]MCB2327530.1 D-alanine--D-alanine ligase [Clostridium tagluense]MCB2332645.1 D-alanine--D-alanine ligase [Clostridium tagluense]
MKIVVLAGGLSPERDVSLSSGSQISNALREAGHSVLLLDVYEGLLVSESEFENLFEDNITGKPYYYKIKDTEPDLNEIKRKSNNGDSLIGKNVLALCQFADVVFIALHGAMGENGQIQATFDVMGIKYTGTGYIGSLLAMDKDLTKKLLKKAGIPTAQWLIFNKNSISTEYILETIGLPCVVKPCSAGSSIGVSIVHNIEALETAITIANKIESSILIEKMILGSEFSVGLLQGKALPVIEIIPKEGFYDYKNKYQAGLTQDICPATLSEYDTNRVQNLALRISEILRLGTYSRMDFILDGSGEFICLEANTLPGMTPTSLIPQEALASGISYIELCNSIVTAVIK